MSESGDQATNSSGIVVSYLTLRTHVGFTGILLPVLPAGYSLLSVKPRVYSISSYYYSGLGGDILVGSICAKGVFLLADVPRTSVCTARMRGIATNWCAI
ncbi:MAG TPA: hypothetical protein VMM38_09455 [Aridibacter sp.]|nr:hypothetical protein [Aridibacter sp.]